MTMPGNYLREKRKEKEFSLEQVAEGTKIRLVYLNAIENNTFNELPAGSYVKGFVKNYARFIGIDDDTSNALAEAATAGREFFINNDIAHEHGDVNGHEKIRNKSEPYRKKNDNELPVIVTQEDDKDSENIKSSDRLRQYGEKVDENQAIETEKRDKVEKTATDLRLEKTQTDIAKAQDQGVQYAEKDYSNAILVEKKSVWDESKNNEINRQYPIGKKRVVSKVRWPERMLIIVIVLFIVGGAGYWWIEKNNEQANVAKNKANTTTKDSGKNAAEEAKKADAAKKKAEATSDNKQSDVVKITSKFNGPCWIKVTIDDATVAYEGVPATGSMMSWEAKNKVDMRIGEPDNVEITYNGKSLGKFGEKGQPITKQFTKNGVQ